MTTSEFQTRLHQLEFILPISSEVAVNVGDRFVRTGVFTDAAGHCVAVEISAEIASAEQGLARSRIALVAKDVAIRVIHSNQMAEMFDADALRAAQNDKIRGAHETRVETHDVSAIRVSACIRIQVESGETAQRTDILRDPQVAASSEKKVGGQHHSTKHRCQHGDPN